MVIRRSGLAVSVVVAAVAVGAALLEVVARVAYRLGRYHPKTVTEVYLQPNPYLYQILRPGSHTRLRDARIDVNSLGFRGPEFSAHKPSDVFRVFVLGGSSTFGYPESIPTTADTYPFKLQQALRRQLGTSRVEVINAGVTGYTLRTNLVNYATRLTWYEPDMIIVYHAVNDLITTRSEDDVLEAVLNAQGPTLAEQIRNSSFLLLELNFRFFKYFRHPSLSRTPTIAPSDDPSAAALASYERNLRHLVELAAADRVAVVIGNESTWIPSVCADRGGTGSFDATMARTCFALQWYFPHLSLTGIRRSFEAVAAIEQRVARERGLVWVDMNRVVPGAPEYYWDFCHTTPRGTTLIADEFARQIGPAVQHSLAAPAAGADERQRTAARATVVAQEEQ